MEDSPVKYIILHGHFYQPPRENPWSGLIPRQPSAGMFHDWNHRITAECYSANTSSRRLNYIGEIVSIDNNFTGISYNVGPTLLSWMEDYAPDTLERIIEADRASRKTFSGHGNALCQGYNHSILPLCDKEDLETQLIWGQEDFRTRFGREPEGIWLPETAINEKVVDGLIDQGFQFTLLSPFQADSIRKKDDPTWHKLKNGAPCDRAFTLKGSRGSLAVFFYDPDLASGISFQHYLKDADLLLKKFQEKASNLEGNLISVATDGEIYGHHEPFGDMCLAAFLEKMKDRKDLVVTNWGEYLERFPPEWEVQLKKGEDHRGTSWSCEHGVSRWYKDCGCHTGGKADWNQSWRSFLRQGFDHLNGELKQIYSRQIETLSTQDPWELRNRYGKVLAGQISKEKFLESSLKNSGNREEARKMLYLLEGQRYAQFMFTSCGWFFNELSGIEPVQNMKYAARAIELTRNFTPKNLEQYLSHYLKKAQSNIREKGNGWDLFMEEALTETQHITRTTAVYLYQEIYGLTPYYRHSSFTFHNLIVNRNNDGSVEGSLQMELQQTQEEFLFHFFLSPLDVAAPEMLKLQEEGESRSFVYPLANLPLEIREEIFYKKRRQTMVSFKENLLSYLPHILQLYQEHQRILPEGDPLTLTTIDATMALSMAGILEKAEEQGLSALSQEELEILDQLFSVKELKQVEPYIHSLCSKIIAFEVENFLEYKNLDTIEILHRFVQVLWKHQVTAVKPYTQNLVYAAFHRNNASQWMGDYLRTKDNADRKLLLSITEKLAEVMNIQSGVLLSEEDFLYGFDSFDNHNVAPPQ